MCVDSSMTCSDSVLERCRKGEELCVLVTPQPCLGARLDLRTGAIQADKVEDAKFREMYDEFVRSVESASSELVTTGKRPAVKAAVYGGRHDWEVRSDGLMHSFSF